MKPTNTVASKTDNGPTSNASLLYNPTFRSVVFQIIAILALVFFFYTIVNNALTNLEARGIATGFGFLTQEAGFGIGLTLIEYDETYSYGRTFIIGLLNTALVSVLGIILATVIGFVMGIARLSSNWLVSRLAAVYIETFRNIPLLLQIFFWYFAVLQALPSARQSLSLGEAIFLNVRGLYFPSPIFEAGSSIVIASFVIGIIATVFISIWARNKQRLTGQQTPMGRIALGLIVVFPTVVYFLMGSPISAEYPELKGFNFKGGVSIIPELAALLLALSIYTASFIAEIVRSGINAVSHGQTEAAMSLGLPRSRTLKLVIVPQALRIIIPPLTSQYLNLTKNSSLAMAIGYPDLVSVFAGTTLNQTGQAIEIIAMTMAVYLSLSLITSALMNIYNRKVALVER
ncbi:MULTISPECIES: amino acid ABC transporter permease [Vibrio]|uniref:Amino acid ABC transporter permease n=1 Tax=Vibrio coralliilyticus TaxID=190893 RepID=A0AAE5GKA9_9VIBR|nr:MULTISPECIES: amino acid ABC transporter permease [Vibrio]KFI09904.1 amino acid ABC transporter permease [Vibrio sp. B183]MCC2524171.1 amino acid ABC transporter permease [Vibrio coralliilyticus]MCM5507369.1 amino acid ABC transporter permease [Vibrio sp. SCSIO 43169]MDE3896212.1 amino acid ABC transporter permease [Vibrio sp. CC007]NOH54180.1 amino acid ABC transporter permease [Vibrio coralliilyticus]